jgi:hypothetical protein
MKKLIYTLLLLLVTFPAMAQSLFEQYERFLTEPRTYVCYRPDGKLKIDGKLNESSWKKAAPTAPFVDISGEGFPTPKYETTAKMLWDDEYLYVGAVLQEEDIRHVLPSVIPSSIMTMTLKYLSIRIATDTIILK